MEKSINNLKILHHITDATEPAMEITMEQMQWLLSGLNIEKIKGFKNLMKQKFIVKKSKKSCQ